MNLALELHISTLVLNLDKNLTRGLSGSGNSSLALGSLGAWLLSELFSWLSWKPSLGVSPWAVLVEDSLALGQTQRPVFLLRRYMSPLPLSLGLVL